MLVELASSNVADAGGFQIHVTSWFWASIDGCGYCTIHLTIVQRERREVVVTGVGLCCHMGSDLERIERELRAGQNTPFRVYDEAVRYGARCQIIGIYPDSLDPESVGVAKAEARFMGRASFMALKAARFAIQQSRIDPTPLGVAIGSGTGDVDTHIEIAETLRTTGSMRRVAATVIPKLMASTLSANLVNVLRTTGPSFTASAACAGGNYNIAIAASWIETGMVDAAIAGGVEVKGPLHFFAGFDSMRAYNRQDNDRPDRASRPYARDRAGFVFSEGAGILVLESRESAESRSAPILGVLRGYGMTSDGAGQMVVPSPEGAEAAIRQALKDAGVSPEDIDYVNTHGTSTRSGISPRSARRCDAFSASAEFDTPPPRGTPAILCRPPAPLKPSSRCR